LSEYLPIGVYGYNVSSANPNYASPGQGLLTVSKAPVNVDVTFSLVTYPVWYNETGIPAKTLAKDGWTVSVAGLERWSSKSSIEFASVAAGTYAVLLTGPSGYVETTGILNTLRVTGPTSVAVSFAKGKTYTLTFMEKGLAKGQSWCVSLDGAKSCSRTTSQKFVNLTASSVYGDYSYAVLSPLADQQITAKVGKTVVASSGSLDLTGSETVAYTFAYAYAVTFTETGLTTGTLWSVTIGKLTESSKGATIEFNLTNGTYSYKIGAIGGYTSAGMPKKAVVNGAATSVAVTYTKKMPVPHAEAVGGLGVRELGALGGAAAGVGLAAELLGMSVTLGLLGAALMLGRKGGEPGNAAKE